MFRVRRVRTRSPVWLRWDAVGVEALRPPKRVATCANTSAVLCELVLAALGNELLDALIDLLRLTRVRLPSR